MDPDEEAALGIDPDRTLRGWQRPVYMVHEHSSRSHHFDLRLEFRGVLRSWAVPKGLSLEPGVKRLAREVPDHALSYAPFEGTIPEGSYGAGEVRIWDRGTFTTLEDEPDRIAVLLKGRKVKGEYHLVRTSMRGDPSNWLVFRAEEQKSPVSSTTPRRAKAPRKTTKRPAKSAKTPPAKRAPSKRPKP